MRTAIAAAGLFTAIIGLSPAAAQDTEQMPPQSHIGQSGLDRRAEDIALVLRGEIAAEQVFAPEFLRVVPAPQLAALAQQMADQFGPLAGVESVTPQSADRGIISLRFKRALARGPFTLGPGSDRLVIGLLLNDFQPVDDNADAIRADIAALPGTVSVLFAPLDSAHEPILAINAGQQLAIGSTFKLYLLAALARSIAKGDRAWSDVVQLDRKSLPSGQMQNWPGGAPVTLHTLATMMISVSDNTAADILLRLMGRNEVEAELIRSGHSNPTKTLPFLSTLQLFAIKGNEEILGRYLAADGPSRRRMADQFEEDVGGDPGLITPPRFSEPTAIDTVEWFASGEDLRKLIHSIAQFSDPTARQIMAINPALPQAQRSNWQYAGYKGGSEPGVLNLTWLLQDKADSWHVLTMGWNNPDAAVAQADLELLALRILSLAS